MATQTKTNPNSFDAAFERAGQAQEQFYAAARKAGNLYLDSYEKAVDRALDLELKVAGNAQQEWVKNLIEAQADLTREATTTYVSTARSLIK
jgi:hypothetical protein